MSRKDISNRLSLTPAAVSILCSALIEDGFISEVGKSSPSEKRAGRREILLSLCLDKLFCIAVNMETENTCVSLVRLDGKLCAMQKFPTNSNALCHLKQTAKKIRQIIDDSGKKEEEIIGAGLGIVGSLDAQAKETAGEFGIWEKGIKAADILCNDIGLTVICENNVKAFATAQLIYANGEDNMLFIKWGSGGIGSALVLGGKVAPGAQEIGHYIIDANGKKCRCGRNGCLETYACAAAIAERVGEIFSQEKTPILYGELNGDKLQLKKIHLSNVMNTDDSVKEIISRRVNRFARAVVNTATVLSPDKVIVFGNMWNKELFREFQEFCKKYSPSFDENRIQMSALQSKADYIGPAALVTDRLFFG